MATHVLTDASVWLHDIAIHDITHTLQFATSREAKDSTVFGHTARSNRAGLMTAQVSVQGYTDLTAYDGDIYDVYNNATTAPVSLSATSADGDPAYTLRTLTASLSPLSGQVGDMAAVSLEAAGRGGVRPVRGTILHPETARTATGTGTGRQLGAVAAGSTVYGALHVVAASAGDTLDVIVQSDDNAGFTTPTTRLTFTQATGTTAEWQSAAGAITDDYWRVSYTIAGTDPSFTFAVVVGIATD
jgi:hypothetical protein